MEFSLQYPNGYGDMISLGLCGDFDVEFLQRCAIKWPELTTTILKESSRRSRVDHITQWPGFSEVAGMSSYNGPYPDQGNTPPRSEDQEEE